MKSLLYILLIALIGCTNDSLVFKNSISGRTPNLKKNSFLLENDTIQFLKYNKKNYIITSNSDSIFIGEIVKKHGVYFLQRKEHDYWIISSFKASKDSLYGFGQAIAHQIFPYYGDSTICEWIEGEYFDKIEEITDDENTIYIVDNDRKETIRFFNIIRKQGNSIKFEKLN